MKENFDNSGKLVRFILRRERIISLIWILALAGFSLLLAPGLDSMFDDEARQQFAAVYDNPLMVGMLGPIYGADNYTSGAMYGGMMLLWVAITAAVMNVFIIARHTRADEERGRVEVLRSLPVGKLAGLNAAMISAVIINFVLAVVTGLGIFAMQVPSFDFASCMLYGAAVGAVGLFFAAVTAVFCQLSSTASGAMGLSFLALGGAYMLRAYGDTSAEFVSWLSPLGLAQRTQVFVGNKLLPLALLLGGAAVITAIAYKLNSTRDLGAGFIPARPGRRFALPAMLSPFGMAFRLLSVMMLVWIIVMFAGAGSYGSVIGDVPGFVSESPEYLAIMGLSPEIIDGIPDETKAEMIVDGFGVFVTSMLALIALIPVLMAALKLRGEEKDGRLENILSRSVSRTKYLCGFTTIAFIFTAIMQCATVLGLYYTTDAATKAAGEANPFVLANLFKACMAFLPAMWILAAVAIFLVGFFPKASAAVWGYYGFTCFTTLMNGLDILPNWLTALSPFRYIPEIRVTNLNLFESEEISFVTLGVMSGIALVIVVAGFVGYRRRDVLGG
ncbi:MAG: ABC transporter permease subunit [Oscillospiraceae bacterium]|nr:ABC transporter permease subunit [Oscillospiraceae bacterium]